MDSIKFTYRLIIYHLNLNRNILVLLIRLDLAKKSLKCMVFKKHLNNFLTLLIYHETINNI